MYTILVNNDNSLIATKKQRIMQRSNLVDDLWFLVSPTYNDFDMSRFTVSLEYVLPVSKKYRNEILTLASDTYNGYLKYVLPFDTRLTSEAGDIELLLTFVLVDLDENGVGKQHIRKANGETIKIFPVTAWSDIIPDEALAALDQRIIKTDAQIKALAELNIIPGSVDGLDYDANKNELQLMAGETPVGNRVALISTDVSVDNAVDEAIKDGIPVVSFGGDGSNNSGDVPETDNVIEF